MTTGVLKSDGSGGNPRQVRKQLWTQRSFSAQGITLGASKDAIVGDDIKLGRVGRGTLQRHWCCGNLGIAEALNYIGRETNLPEAKQKGVVLLEETLERGLKGGFFRLESTLGENFCFSPSLFRGTAGIGYSLLRFAHPGELPCILAFEV